MVSAKTNDDLDLDARIPEERRTLLKVFGVNLLQVVMAGGVGLAADSTGLLGAALDNLGDALVYLVSLYAVGRTVAAKSLAAYLSGGLLCVTGLALAAEVVRRTVVHAEPIGGPIIIMACVNVALNYLCLRLLRAHREHGIHLKASWIFTSNDMLVNAGLAASGIAVMLLGSAVPDLLIGIVVAGAVVRSGWTIVGEARSAMSTSDAEKA